MSEFWPKENQGRKISDITFIELESLNKAIYSEHRVDFLNYEKRSLIRRVNRVIDNFEFESVEALKDKLLSDPAFIEDYIYGVTVDLTEMFRDPKVWIYLRDVTLPSIKTNSTVNFWHAGCSTGAEPYSMAILLQELNALSKVKLFATDLNKLHINYAIQGRYGNKELATYAKNYRTFGGKKSLEDYFTNNDFRGNMNKSLKQAISFFAHDLSSCTFLINCELIMCRNVMIYFNLELKKKVYQLFHKKLKVGGYLVIGLTDTMTHNEFRNKYRAASTKYKVYQKLED